MNENLYLFFKDEIACILYFTIFKDFLMEFFLKNLEEKVKKNHIK